MQFITLMAQCQVCYIALPDVKMCDKSKTYWADNLDEGGNFDETARNFGTDSKFFAQLHQRKALTESCL